MEPFWIFNGISQVVFIVVVWAVGLRIAYKYVELKDKSFLFVGMVWIGLAEPYLATAVSFTYTLITNTIIPVKIFLLIGFIFTPVSFFLWMYIFTSFVYRKRLKIVLIITGIIALIFEVLFLIFLFTQPNSTLGVMKPPWRIDYKPFIQGWIILLLVSFLITGVIFGCESLKSIRPEFKLKGIFLILAFITFIIGAILDTFPQYTTEIYQIIIKRSVLILASLLFYLGFILPDWVKQLLLKEE